MNNSEQNFNDILKKFTSNNPLVHEGKMMSSRALTFNGKVFAFFHNNEMGFKLGPNFDAPKWGIVNAKPLSPFKTKPPLKGWYLIDQQESDQWESLTEMALAFISNQKQ